MLSRIGPAVAVAAVLGLATSCGSDGDTAADDRTRPIVEMPSKEICDRLGATAVADGLGLPPSRARSSPVRDGETPECVYTLGRGWKAVDVSVSALRPADVGGETEPDAGFDYELDVQRAASADETEFEVDAGERAIVRGDAVVFGMVITGGGHLVTVLMAGIDLDSSAAATLLTVIADTFAG